MVAETWLAFDRSAIFTKFDSIAVERIVQTGLALRLYYNDHQTLPRDLTDLVPQYLAKVLSDPYDGESLIYDPLHGLVYSIGTSRFDNGGSRFAKMNKDHPDYEDPLSDKNQPTLKLEFQNPPSTPAIPAPSTTP